MTDKVKIFLIDDDRFVLKSLKQVFEGYDVELFTFLDPSEALVEMQKHKPQIVFLDYNMEEMTGKDVIVKVSEVKLFCHCSMYLVSGSDFSDIETIKLKTLGFYDIFQKPLTETTIEKVLKSHLGHIPYKAA